MAVLPPAPSVVSPAMGHALLPCDREHLANIEARLADVRRAVTLIGSEEARAAFDASQVKPKSAAEPDKAWEDEGGGHTSAGALSFVRYGATAILIFSLYASCHVKH